MERLTISQRISIERSSSRPHIGDFIKVLFTDFFEQKGDHLFDDDKSIYGGIARFHGIPVTVLGHRKGHTIEDNIEYNYGMPRPEGYRKALRIMKQAEKFSRPIITFVDTPGAFPGEEAEKHGQGEAIARNLAEMSHLAVPIITVVTGEGNSGGAIAISVANKVIMMENAIYSVLSPEGFASILWGDAGRAREACDLMKISSYDLKKEGFCDVIIKEPEGGLRIDSKKEIEELDAELLSILNDYSKMTTQDIIAERREKFRNMDSYLYYKNLEDKKMLL